MPLLTVSALLLLLLPRQIGLLGVRVGKHPISPPTMPRRKELAPPFLSRHLGLLGGRDGRSQ